MLDRRLNKIREHVETWCSNHNIPINIVCDTTGIQGVKIYERSPKALSRLFEGLAPVLKADDIFLDTQKVRGGLVLAFSVKALSESEINTLLRNAGEICEPMSFKERLKNVFTQPIQHISETNQEVNQEAKPVDLYDSAIKIVESQYKSATNGATRCNQNGRQRNLNTEVTNGGEIKKKKAKTVSFENTIGRIFDNSGTNQNAKSMFNNQLHETLQGMATSNDVQPGDVFQKFAKALSVLGQQMGGIPLQDQLKQQGISWKKSDDGQNVVLFVTNASTNAPMAIAQISSETISKPNEFETALLQMIDFAKGKAPGAFKQEQAAMQAQEKAVREIAKAFDPEAQIAQQMGDTPTTAASQAAAPKQAAPQAPQVPQKPQVAQQPKPQATPNPQAKIPAL